VLIFSKNVWDRLSPQDRVAIRAAAKDSVALLRDRLDAYEATAREVATAAGSQINEDVDKKSFTDVLVPLRDRLLLDHHEQELVQLIRSSNVATAPEPQPGTLSLPK